jgi:hypothetical protein
MRFVRARTADLLGNGAGKMQGSQRREGETKPPALGKRSSQLDEIETVIETQSQDGIILASAEPVSRMISKNFGKAAGRQRCP